MTKKNLNLGKYDLNKLLANPMLIHQIQDALLDLKDDSIFADSLRNNAKDKPRECVKMICEQYADNPPLIKRIVGEKVLDLIQEYTGTTLADDLNNIIN